MSKSRIPKELLPAATTIYTPDWPVRYMVENSLGRTYIQYKLAVSGQLLVDSEEERVSREKEIAASLGWKYYLPEAQQTEAVRKELNQLNPATFDPMDLRLLDPCVGSGHILAYMFDVLVTIYQDYGYTTREAVRTIVSQNLWGLDIDHRAAQLAYFTVMMKACQYDRRFLTRGIQPKVYAITESNHISTFAKDQLALDPSVKEAFHTLLEELRDAREYGSILTVTPQDWETLEARLTEMEHSLVHSDVQKIRNLLHVGETLSQKYDVVVTNPPYLSNSRFSVALDKFVKKHYPEVKSDLSMVMYKHVVRDLCKENGYVAFITTTSWMFLSSFEKLRAYILGNFDFVSLVDFGTELFEGKVGHNPIVSWVTRNTKTDYIMTGIRLVEFCYSRRDEKEGEFFNHENYQYPKQTNFTKIPGSPVAYWVGENVFNLFNSQKIGDVALPASGTSTGDNDIFLKLWHEISIQKINFKARNAEHNLGRWFPCNKGGSYRKWAGGSEYVIDWENDGNRIKNCKKAYLRNIGSVFMPGLTWSKLGSGAFSVRQFGNGFICESIGCSLFKKSEKLEFVLSLLNSKVGSMLLSIINPSLGRQPGYIGSIPYIVNSDQKNKIMKRTIECIAFSTADWDSYETSWDFKTHPLVRRQWPADSGQSEPIELTTSHYPLTTIAEAYENWKQTCNARFKQLQQNEEELNRIFIDIYGLQDELTPEVVDKDVTVHCIYDTKEEIPECLQGSNYVRTKRDEIVSFLSYAVGCMLGRYSLEKEGLFYAGGDWEETLQNATSHYSLDTDHFIPDEDNVLPICDDEYFQDDIVGRLIEFVRVVYGEETLDENLEFISEALGGKKGERPKDVIRNYFLKDFYKDHCKMYQKRPIYWLFDSGKKNGFKCLVYLHRYRRDTIARIRTDYVHPQQSRYRTLLEDLEKRLEDASTTEKVRLRKEIKLRSDQLMEIHEFEEKIHHLADRMITIDLDDGVKKNYAIFQDVLAKIK